ncbi:MAG: hypothetical protein M1819_000579 [Sarea resinae]|nr:MAG: hypothetical protein M1819_000579 [Sarea resinae]
MAQDEQLEQLESGLARTFKDLFSGAAGGVAQVLIGQPFDIVKVRLQTTTEYANAADCAAKIWKNEGAAAFYKGTLTPLIGIGACVSVQFGAFHYARRAFSTQNTKNNSSPTLSYTQYYLSGAFAGVANTFLSSPIEHIRIRLQTQPHDPAKRLYAGPLDCIRKLTAHAGFGRGVYRGVGVTTLREAQAYGFWFLTFEWLMNETLARRRKAHVESATGIAEYLPSSSSARDDPADLFAAHKSAESVVTRASIPTYLVAFYGGLAGEALWIASYPFDVLKSKLQSDGFGEGKQRYKSAVDCFWQTWRGEGARGFWKGIGPTLLRAMPVSAGTFVV